MIVVGNNIVFTVSRHLCMLACFYMMTDIHCSVGQFMTDHEVCNGHSEGCVFVLVNTSTSSETAATECEWLYHNCLRGKSPRSIINDLLAVLNKVVA